jgi:hypothetical protein
MLTDRENEVVIAIREKNDANAIDGIICRQAGCSLSEMAVMSNLCRIIQKLDNQLPPSNDDFIGLDELNDDDFMGLNSLDDEDQVSYIKRVRIKTRSIVDTLEPHHINGLQTLKERLECALDEVKMMETQLEHDFKA